MAILYTLTMKTSWSITVLMNYVGQGKEGFEIGGLLRREGKSFGFGLMFSAIRSQIQKN